MLASYWLPEMPQGTFTHGRRWWESRQVTWWEQKHESEREKRSHTHKQPYLWEFIHYSEDSTKGITRNLLPWSHHLSPGSTSNTGDYNSIWDLEGPTSRLYQGHSTRHLSSVSKPVNIKKEKSEKLSHKQEPKDTWQLNVVWYPGWDLGMEEGHGVKIKDILIQYGL